MQRVFELLAWMDRFVNGTGQKWIGWTLVLGGVALLAFGFSEIPTADIGHYMARVGGMILVFLGWVLVGGRTPDKWW